MLNAVLLCWALGRCVKPSCHMGRLGRLMTSYTKSLFWDTKSLIWAQYTLYTAHIGQIYQVDFSLYLNFYWIFHMVVTARQMVHYADKPFPFKVLASVRRGKITKENAWYEIENICMEVRKSVHDYKKGENIIVPYYSYSWDLSRISISLYVSPKKGSKRCKIKSKTTLTDK